MEKLFVYARLNEWHIYTTILAGEQGTVVFITLISPSSLFWTETNTVRTE
jgi:hypothetical protein